MNQFLLINKPPGITSFFIVERVKEITGIKKVGHMGTLDPRACGLLLVGLDKAVRLEEYIINLDKSYFVEIIFGVSSETYDREAKNFYYSPKEIDKDELERLIKSFIGEREQIPPSFSALHIQGKRAYDLARKGKEINLPKRKIRIYNAELKYFENSIFPKALIEFKVSSGTYIRSLVREIGERLKVHTLTSFLLRTQIGKLHINQALLFKNLQKDWRESLVSPLEILNFPSFIVLDRSVRKVKNGNIISIEEVENFSTCPNPIILLDNKREILAIAYHNNGIIKPVKVFN